ncbi:MAG: UbiA prenyltransferase family protein [Lachnospiraceae bacterium]|nr:UbiA prenyltransferase family protein [Lachnospiraceae bacterium]
MEQNKKTSANQSQAQLMSYIKIARPDHWIKNVFIMPGLVLAVILSDKSISVLDFMIKLTAGFFATCFIASANYVINEWLDAEFDKYHPTKKNRPVVSQNMKFSLVMVEYAVCIVIGLLLSLPVNIPFLLTEIWLLVMGVLYNVKPIRTKDIVYLDVLSESINNMIRLLLGWFIICDNIYPPSSILVGYWMAGAFLMAVKRYAEYRMIGDLKLAGAYRKSFAKYTEATLLCSSFYYGLCATFLIGIFLLKYRIEYIVAIPVLFFLFCYYLYIAYKPDSAAQKPEKLFREKKLMILVGVLVILFAVLTFVDIPVMDVWENAFFIPTGR